MTPSEIRDAILQNQEMSRKLLRLIAIKLGWDRNNNSGRDEHAFWAEVEQRWREWTGSALPHDDASWRKIVHWVNFDLKPPEELDRDWLRKHLLPALLARQKLDQERRP